MDYLSNTVTIKKANRVVSIDETQLKGYLARGYDQINSNGKVVKTATDGKTISIAEHQKVVNELADLQTSYDELEEKAKDFAAKGKALKEENDRLKKK